MGNKNEISFLALSKTSQAFYYMGAKEKDETSIWQIPGIVFRKTYKL